MTTGRLIQELASGAVEFASDAVKSLATGSGSSGGQDGPSEQHSSSWKPDLNFTTILIGAISSAVLAGFCAHRLWKRCTDRDRVILRSNAVLLAEQQDPENPRVTNPNNS